MTVQLVLFDEAQVAEPATAAVWELDPATCEIGRRGVAAARRTLQAARARRAGASVAGQALPAAA